jgi:hypothetical protein
LQILEVLGESLFIDGGEGLANLYPHVLRSE